MSTTLEWPEIALRLALTVIGGLVLGINRSERGMAAGMRTTLLVCLAASVSMIQANLLLGTAGRPPDSFIMMDLMRLPLGILTGMGFIGAGAILRRGELVVGVTTAATLWLATVIGLCFGGGQNALGVVTVVLGLVTLWILKWVELRMRQERRGTLSLSLQADGPTDAEVRESIKAAGLSIVTWDVGYRLKRSTRLRTLQCELHWWDRHADGQPTAFVNSLAERPGVVALRWKA